MKSVHVLAIVDGFNDFLLVDVFRQRQLHNESVHIVVGVKTCDSLKQFRLGHIGLIANERRFKSTLLTGFHFVSHIGLASTVVTHKNRSKMRTFLSSRNHFSHFRRNLLLHSVGNFFSID